MVRGSPVTRALRLLFEEYGELSPYEAYQELCVNRGLCKNYSTIVTYFNILKKLGLIRVVENEPSSRGGWNKTVYEMTPGLEDHPCWDKPMCCYKPEWCRGREYEKYWPTGIAPTLHKIVAKLREKGKI